MKIGVCVTCLVAAAGWATVASAQQPSAPSEKGVQTAGQPQSSDLTSTSPERPKLEMAPTPADVRPGRPYIRVRSVPGPTADVRPLAAPDAQTSVSKRTDGLIAVPANTLGPGESLQQRNERLTAENRRLAAEAAIAEREAARPNPRYEDGVNVIPFLTYRRFGVHGQRPLSQDLRREPSQDRVGFEDQLHGGALRVFSDAAAAGTGVLGNLHQDAIRNFGQAATPPLLDQQRERDRAQRNLQRATPAGK